MKDNDLGKGIATLGIWIGWTVGIGITAVFSPPVVTLGVVGIGGMIGIMATLVVWDDR